MIEIANSTGTMRSDPERVLDKPSTDTASIQISIVWLKASQVLSKCLSEVVSSKRSRKVNVRLIFYIKRIRIQTGNLVKGLVVYTQLLSCRIPVRHLLVLPIGMRWLRYVMRMAG